MRTWLPPTLLLLLPFFSAAQKDLSTSPQHSALIYAYRLTDKQARDLFQGDLRGWEKMPLAPPTDSFPVEKEDSPRLSPGNYLFIRAVESRLEVTLRTVGSLTYHLLYNGNVAAMVLHSSNGQPVTDATASIRNHPVRFDSSIGYYLLGRWKKRRIVQVNWRGTIYFFPVDYQAPRSGASSRRWWRRLWHPNRYHKYHPAAAFQFQKRYRSYFVLSKPKYKPGDTVSGKAFIMDRKGRPVRIPLLLRLNERDHGADTLLQTLRPYRAGGYSFSFMLSDSLKMELDEGYELSLEVPVKHRHKKDDQEEDDDWRDRKVVKTARFHFEEYDLSSIRLKARADREKQSSGEPVSVYLQALDENDLPVPDGRVELTVLSSQISGFRDPVVFVKDTLWRSTQQLDPVGETRIILPDSIFPAAAFEYTIECRLLNSDDETSEKELTVHYNPNPATIDFRLHGDSLDISYRLHGRPEAAMARVSAWTKDDDIIDGMSISLPATLRVNPLAKSYEATVIRGRDTLTDEYEFPQETPEFPIVARRTADSVVIHVDDTLHVSFWYTLLAGRKPVLRGYADKFDYAERSTGSEPYTLRLQYLWKGVLHQVVSTLPFLEKQVNIDVRQPGWVYPGQRVNIDVAVTDAYGRAVPDADVTAYAWTAKFKDVNLANIPYLGRQWYYPRQGSYRVPDEEEQKQASVPLDWSRWKSVFGLDTLEYYKFLNPATIYLARKPTPDGVTQLAPFVTRKGQPEPVYLLYLDERMIFFDKAEQRRYYSFSASPGYHTLRIRVHDREITIDSVLLVAGMKTILGINDDTANPAIRTFSRPDTLSNWEKDLLRQSLITVQNSFAPHFATVGQGDGSLFLLTPADGGFRRTWLTGPLTNSDAVLDVRDGFQQTFEPEGGNQFIIRPGLIKETQWPYSYPFDRRLDSIRPLTGLKDRALTRAIADSLWQDWLDERSAGEDLYVNEKTSAPLRGNLQLGILRGEDGNAVFVKKVFVFRYDDADFLHVHKGKTTEVGMLEAGVYRVLLLLKGDRYLLHDSVVVRPNGLNYYSLDRLPINEPDTFSRRIAGMLRHLEDRWVNPKSPGMDSLHFVFNDRYLRPAAFDGEAGGTVTGPDGNPAQGVSIMIKGTRRGTVTDGNGRFHLWTPTRGTLVFAYIGCETVEKSFFRPEQYNIHLHAASNALQEVVVMGYSETTRRLSTGSVMTVTSSGLVPVLMGRVAGLSITEAGAEDISPAFPAIPKMPGLDTVRSIRRHFRDDAFWQPRLRTDAQGLVSFPVTYPDDITAWNSFFIAVGDHGRTGFTLSAVRSAKPLSARLSNPNFLIAGDSAFVIGKLLNYTSDSVTVNRKFTIGEQKTADATLRFRIARIDTFLVGPSATRGRGPQPDSIHISYTLQRPDGYFDGEERSIPVLPAGTKETRGTFAPLEGDTGLSLRFDTALGPVHVFAGATLLPVLLDEIESIRQYEYLCNEQMASKLLALLQKQHIFQLEKTEFREDKNIHELIDRLMKARGGKPLWGWWLEGSGMPWISLHVIQALLAAEKAGYATGLDKRSLIDFLVYNFESGTSFDRLLDLRIMQELGAKVDYRRYTDTALRHLDRTSLYEVLRLQEIRQAAGLATLGLDTLVSKMRTTALGNIYWGEDGPRFFDNSVQVTILMYRVLRRSGGYENLLRKARNWLLEQRGAGHWRNTYESSLILETLLPDVLVGGKPPKSPELSINGNRVPNFPYQAVLPPGAGLDVQKSGVLPVYFTAYQQFFNPEPKRVEGVFAVRSWFEWTDTVRRLKAGKPVTLFVEVDAKADADYVLVEIPIPAGCTYSDKSQWHGDQGIHREYFKNKLSIFCPFLGKGKHVFGVQLLPRWTGAYRLNPARAELMYFPVLFGREGMKKTVIE